MGISHRGGGAECNKSVTTLACEACYLGGSALGNFGFGLDLVHSLRF